MKPARTNVETIVLAAIVASAVVAAWLVFELISFETHNVFVLPIWDEVGDWLRYYRHEAGITGLVRYLLTPHNEHIIATTRLVALVDALVWHGRGHLQIVVGNLFQIGSAAVVYCVFRTREMNGIERVWSFLCIALFFLNANYLYDFIIPFQDILFFTLGLLAVLTAYIVSGVEGNAETRGTRYVVAALVGFAAIGTISIGGAPALLIGATGAAVVLRWKPRWIVLLGVLAVMHASLELAIVHMTGNGGKGFDPLATAKFSLLFLGSPFMRISPWPAAYVTWWWSANLGIAIGALEVAIVSCFAFVRLQRPGWGGRVASFGLVLAFIVIVTAMAAGYSRALSQGILDAANKKYASTAALGWVAVLMIVTGVLRELLHDSRRANLTAIAAALLIVLPLSWTGLERETRIWRKITERNWEAGLASLLKVNDGRYLAALYRPNSDLGELIGYLDSANRAVFSYYPFRWGDDARSLFADRQPTNCHSEVERLDPVPASGLTNVFQSPGTPVTISGWAWMDNDRAPPKTVIAVDSQNRIVGVAGMTRTSARAEEWLGQEFNQKLGWFGFARLTEPPPVTFFALSREGKHFCTLGRADFVSTQQQSPTPNFTTIKFPPIENEPPGGADEASVDVCEGSIDSVNGAPPGPDGAKVTRVLSVTGWMTVDGRNGLVPDRVYATLMGEDGRKRYIGAERVPRDDLKQHFNQPNLPDVGWQAAADVSQIPGKMVLGLSRMVNGHLEACKNFKVPLQRGNAEPTETPPVVADRKNVELDAIRDQALAGLTEKPVDSCEGNLDTLNGALPNPAGTKIGGLLTAEGWMAISAKDGVIPDDVFISLADSQGLKFYIKGKSALRADLGEHFNQPSLVNAGFRVNADVSKFSGKYWIGVSRIFRGVLETCSNMNYPVLLGQ